MKYSFFGTPKFAEIILQKLIEKDFKPQVVICNPDKPVGRKHVLTPPSTKIIATGHGILVWQPKKLNFSQFDILKTNDIFIVAAYSKIIPEEILEIPKKGAIGVHPSLLPKYRGTTPIRSAILSGEEKTGVSIYKMDKKMDHGPIIAQKEVEIGDRNYITLKEELAEIGAELLIESISGYLTDDINLKTQEHSKATFTKKFLSEDAYINPDKLKFAIEKGGKEAEEVWLMIRALNPEPGVWTKFKNPYKDFPKEKRIKLLRSNIKNGKLILSKIHIDGKVAREVNIFD